MTPQKQWLIPGRRQGAFETGLEYFVVLESEEVFQVAEDMPKGHRNQTKGVPIGQIRANVPSTP